MVRGLYTAYTGMLNQQYRLDTLTNNLANSDTTGFKAENTTAKSFDDVLTYKIKDGSEYYINRRIGKMALGVKIGENYTDYSQGSFKDTGNTYDLALDGKGFFAISFTSKAGKTYELYTRDGEFTTDAEGVLRTKDGDFVLDESGSNIVVPTDAQSVSIDQTGRVFADGEQVGQLKLVDFEDYNYLKKYGENLLQAVDGATQKDFTGTVNQGYLETSNVNVVETMVDLITITRAYESNQKIIQAIDDTLDKAVNNVGRV